MTAISSSQLAGCPVDAADASFLRALAAGEPRAVRTLYDTHARYIAGVLHRLLRADQDVDDLLQETFLAALDAIHTVDKPQSLRAFLATIAVRKALRTLVKRRRRRALFAFFALFGAPHSDPNVQAPAEDLCESLQLLPEDLRVPWILARVEDWTLPEVAKACGASLATTKRRIALAEDRLQQRLKASS